MEDEETAEGRATDGRESWDTRTGFVLAAAGSTVGLGNVWRFPFQTGQEGGAAFLAVYLGFVLLVGLPVMLLEFMVGRRHSRSPVAAIYELGEGAWKNVGWVFVAAAFLVLSYYTVVAGWASRYAVDGVLGRYPTEIAGAEARFAEVATGADAVAFHGLFMVLTVTVVALGLNRGVETAARLLVPTVLALLGGLVYYAYRLPGASEAYRYYLSPDFGVVAAEWTTILPAAAGQAFFTLSLGMGIMITYASYVDEPRNLTEDAAFVVGIDTLVAVAVGLVVFPILFTAGVPPGEPGHGSVFVSLTTAFASLPNGGLLGAAFFGIVALVALLTTISLMEVVVSHLIDTEGLNRGVAAVTSGGALPLLGVPAALSLVVLDLYDVFATQILLVVGALLLTVYMAWISPSESAREGISDLTGYPRGYGRLAVAWIWMLRVPILAVLLVSLALGVVEYVDLLRSEIAPAVEEAVSR